MTGSRNYEIRKGKDGTRDYLLLRGPGMHDVAEVMREKGLRDLRLSHYTDWRGRSIEFLSEVPFLEWLDLWAVGIRDISPLYGLSRLKSLSLNMVPGPVEIGN